MAFGPIPHCPRGRNRAPFRSTIDGCRDNGNRSFGRGGHLGFFGTSQNSQNGILGKLLIALRVEIELRFALLSTVAEITAIEVLAVAAILDFSEHLKMAKMAFWAIDFSPLGRNRAPFRSTIDGFRHNGNRSLDLGGHLVFFKASQNGQNGIFGNCLLPLGSKSSSVSHYNRRFPR